MNNQAGDKQGFKNILGQKTNYWVAGSVLMLLIIFYGSASEQDKMLSAQSDHDHEKALLIASNILAQNPNDSTAKVVIKKSGQLFFYLQEAKLIFKQFQTTADKLFENPELLSEELHKARVFTAKAKAIDPLAQRLLAFESILDEAENKLSYSLAMNAISSGQAAILEVSGKYQKTTEIIEATATSPYLDQLMTFQSSATSIGKSVEELKKSIEPHLQEMQKISQLIDSAEAKDKMLTDLLTTYITTVKSTIDTLVTPRGAFKDFTTIADKAIANYKKSLSQLKNKLPQHYSTKASLTDLVDSLTRYKVFHDHSIYQIMASNKAFFE